MFVVSPLQRPKNIVVNGDGFIGEIRFDSCAYLIASKKGLQIDEIQGRILVPYKLSIHFKTFHPK